MIEGGKTPSFRVGMIAVAAIFTINNNYVYRTEMKYRRHSHSITNMNFHIILCSKYRKAYFHKIKSRRRLLSCFRNSCIKNGCALVECEIMPDHIHMFVSVVKPVRFNHYKIQSTNPMKSTMTNKNT